MGPLPPRRPYTGSGGPWSIPCTTRDLGEFQYNPLSAVGWQKPEGANDVDPRVGVNLEQARSLLCAVSYVGGFKRARGRSLVGLFAGMYLGGFRPAEAVGLSLSDLTLPDRGWGEALLNRSRSSVGEQWTDSSLSHEDSGLKSRLAEEVRRVPIPPELVSVLQGHVDTFETAAHGRLFYSEHGGAVSSSTYYRPGRRLGSWLGWLNAGVDPTEIAARAGNSVEVLLGRYAKCPRRPAGGRQPADRGVAPRVRVRGEPLRPEAPGETWGPSCFPRLTWGVVDDSRPRIGRRGCHTAAWPGMWLHIREDPVSANSLMAGSLGTSCEVPPAGFEPAHTAPEAVALSPELRGRVVRVAATGGTLPASAG
ncbi:hypothetical protein GCM10017778_11950 [Streptomyces vinaceus]|nr:hypothetical protein GCM10017778_11950 [Streptomyces vinaceus]